ncbi:hypothetical protein V6N11_002910 [Hibiscus sabdariffa]|uniref:Epidermal patterning factor-like protein n=1 Tax=Hibiscus sabdariffa TaxID=183260 RepID=A0ABR2SBW5_9ROSI
MSIHKIRKSYGLSLFGFQTSGNGISLRFPGFPNHFIYTPIATIEFSHIAIIITQSTSPPFLGFQDMERRLFCFLLALQIVRWTCATSRPLAPNDDFGAHQPDQKPEALQVPLSSKEISLQSMERTGAINGEGENKMGIGSSPPNCEHKCYGCTPCEAIQVPTTTSKRVHVGLQYTNYKPECWKCKCGSFFYSP